MKIGDEVYVHGYVDEIRKDVVIVQNEGGYFGTIETEIRDEATARHGVWEYIKEHPRSCRCSECWSLFPQSRTQYFSYCPSCGAMMTGSRYAVEES